MAMDDRRTGSTAATKISGDIAPGLKRVVVRVDCASNDVANGDIVQLLYVPIGYIIDGAGADVQTAEGGTLTFHMGLHLASNDSEVDADGFLASADGNVAGAKMTASEAYANVQYPVTAAVNVTATFNNAADAAVIDFVVWLREAVV